MTPSPCSPTSTAGYLSPETAREIYFVVYDEENLAVDAEATTAARDAERAARKARGVPYAEFVASWVTAEPPSHLPYYGSWGDDSSVIHATAWTTHGPLRVAGPMSELPPIFLPDPNVLALAAQQARIAELEARLHERGARQWLTCWRPWTSRHRAAPSPRGSTRWPTAGRSCCPAGPCRGTRRER